MSFIGLDIGGTSVRYAVAEKDNMDKNSLLCYQKKPFIKTGSPYTEVENNICSVIRGVPDRIDGIGISLAAIMDRRTGIVKTWPNNACWEHYRLKEHLEKRFQVPIVLEDDANCGAIGEYKTLKEKTDNMAYIAIGTGIGCGLILNGKLFTGEHGFAGELGHTCMATNGEETMCVCGNKNCFQSIASGPAVLRKYNTATGSSLGSLKQIDWRLAREPVWIRCLVDMVAQISTVIYNLVMVLDLSVVLIGGGVSGMNDNIIPLIEGDVNERLHYFERAVSVKPAKLGDFSSVYGALLLVNKHL